MRVQLLGQSGVRAWTAAGVVYVDPYLSDSVERLEGPSARRLRPAPFPPSEVRDAAWVLVTHEHLDHCDPDTLGALAQASPRAKVVAPAHLRPALEGMGFAPDRVVEAPLDWMDLGGGTRLVATAASHPEPRRDGAGNPWACAYVLEEQGSRYLFTGDTSLTDDLKEGLLRHTPYRAAFLPINERNHYKEKAGIIGNMTLRETFGLMTELAAPLLVPQHWDMFASNRVFPEEATLLHERLRPPFRMEFDPREV